MVNPTTVNVLLEAPVHGAEVDTWDQPVNRDWTAIDGLFGGVGIVGVSNLPVTLTIPAGLGPAVPAPGPWQSQNRVLRFTGALTANVTVTLPLATKYVIDNQTTGDFNLIFRALTLGQVVAVPYGCQMSVYNDGTNCYFADLAKVGDMEFWDGITAIPSWVTACTIPPYLLCSGQLGLFATYPHLGRKFGSLFGGNGITTFGTPDLQGRVPLAYDATGGRITVGGGAGFNGQTIGASGGAQGSQLSTTHLPAYTPAGSVTTTLASSSNVPVSTNLGGTLGIFNFYTPTVTSGNLLQSSFTGNAQGGASSIFSNVLPAQVAGIWVVKT